MKLETRKRLTVLLPVVLLAMMGTMVYYAVPLYRLFCQVTGYGGTTQQAIEAPGAVAERTVRVTFDATVNPELPWRFRPVQREVEVRIGEERLVFYEAENLSDQTVVGSATFNVTPAKAGQYFVKIDCFCFTEQALEPGQRADMPVSFFVDPAIMEDDNMDDVDVITLSYTFFRNEEAEEELAQAGADEAEQSASQGGEDSR